MDLKKCKEILFLTNVLAHLEWMSSGLQWRKMPKHIVIADNMTTNSNATYG